MLVYFLIACDRLEEKREKKLRQNLPELQAALRAYAEANTANNVEFDGESAREAERLDLQRRIREVAQGPDGAIWVLEDGRRGGNGALLKLTPKE